MSPAKSIFRPWKATHYVDTQVGPGLLRPLGDSGHDSLYIGVVATEIERDLSTSARHPGAEVPSRDRSDADPYGFYLNTQHSNVQHQGPKFIASGLEYSGETSRDQLHLYLLGGHANTYSHPSKLLARAEFCSVPPAGFYLGVPISTPQTPNDGRMTLDRPQVCLGS